MGRVRKGDGVAWVVLVAMASGLGGHGCKSKAKADADAASTSAEGSALTSATEGGPAADAGKAAAKPTLTQEQAFEQATQRVADATSLTKEKKPDCDKIVDALDVAFATVNPAMGADDRATFSTFASCAKKAQRWRLLRDVANAMIDGDPAYKTSYYLPRALLGLAQYETASRMAKELLRAWPKEGEAYTTGALASARLEEWTTCDKQADQAIVVQRQKGVTDDIVAQAYVWKAEAALHTGKMEDSNHDLDVAKRLKSDLAAKLRDRNDVVKSSGLLVEPDIEGEIFLGLSHLYAKGLPIVGSPVILKLTAFSDKPVAAHVEVSADAVVESIGKAVNVVRARRETVKLSPPLHADTKPESVTDPKDVKLTYKVTSNDGTSLYEETRTVTIEPLDRLPTSIRVHESEYRMVHELDAVWVTPGDKAITGVLDAAKKRTSGDFAGTQGETLPQVQALWDELRSRGFAFSRDPGLDTEATRAVVARLPRVVVEAEGGSALEGNLVFASLMESIGLEVVLVRLPGHALVGWLPSKADKASPDAMKSTVPSPVGGAFLLDTTMIGEGPFDAAVLRGDAELVDSASKGVFSGGRGTIFKLTALRKAGIVPKPD